MEKGPTFGIDLGRASKIVRAYAAEQGLPVPPLSWEKAPEIEPSFTVPSRRSMDARRIEPGNRRVQVLGILREITLGLDPVQKLEVQGPIFERQLLRHVTPRVAQITVTSERGQELESFTAFLPEGCADTGRLLRGTLLSLDLSPVHLPAIEPFWVVKALEDLN